jgi:hypothetical protein
MAVQTPDFFAAARADFDAAAEAGGAAATSDDLAEVRASLRRTVRVLARYVTLSVGTVNVATSAFGDSRECVASEFVARADFRGGLAGKPRRQGRLRAEPWRWRRRGVMAHGWHLIEERGDDLAPALTASARLAATRCRSQATPKPEESTAPRGQSGPGRGHG